MTNYIPYSEYPLWQLKEWKQQAEMVGDSAFVAIMCTAIEKVEKAEKPIDNIPEGENHDRESDEHHHTHERQDAGRGRRVFSWSSTYTALPQSNHIGDYPGIGGALRLRAGRAG